MPYHQVGLKIVPPTDPNADRIFWELSTQWSQYSASTVGTAYTDISDDYKIIRWASNDNVIPSDIMDGIIWPHKAAMDVERNVQTRAVLDGYIEAQANRTPEQIAEEDFEMRAAFGEGTSVFNVITGTRRTI